MSVSLPTTRRYIRNIRRIAALMFVSFFSQLANEARMYRIISFEVRDYDTFRNVLVAKLRVGPE